MDRAAFATAGLSAAYHQISQVKDLVVELKIPCVSQDEDGQLWGCEIRVFCVMSTATSKSTYSPGDRDVRSTAMTQLGDEAGKPLSREGV